MTLSEARSWTSRGEWRTRCLPVVHTTQDVENLLSALDEPSSREVRAVIKVETAQGFQKLSTILR
jgi:hypothetical protein